MSMKISFIILAAVALFLAGCSPLGVVVDQMNAVTPAANFAIDSLEAQYKADLRAADDPAKVRDCYAPAFEAHRAFVASWEGARQVLAFAASLENAGAIADAEIGSAVRAITETSKAFEAFERLSKALKDKDRCGSSKHLAESTAGQPA